MLAPARRPRRSRLHPRLSRRPRCAQARLRHRGVTLSKHSDATAEDFAQFLEGLDEVQQAHTVAGDADYLLHIRARSLDEMGDFVLKRLLPHPHVHQVRSDIVLKTIKENRGFRIGLGAGRKTRKSTGN
jgi:DNA-binding Lrp family transcriptional regulator